MHESTSSSTVGPGKLASTTPAPSPGVTAATSVRHRRVRLVLFGLGLVATMSAAVALPMWLVG